MISKAKGESGAAPPAPKSLVPEKYNKPESSDLTKTVKEGSNTIDLELKSS